MQQAEPSPVSDEEWSESEPESETSESVAGGKRKRSAQSEANNDGAEAVATAKALKVDDSGMPRSTSEASVSPTLTATPVIPAVVVNGIIPSGSDSGNESTPTDAPKTADGTNESKTVEHQQSACRKCTKTFAFPIGNEFVRCPYCKEVVQVADLNAPDDRVKLTENDFYKLLGDYKSHFDRSNYAVVWLARASATRSWKLAVPKSCRLPKSNAGQGGYATVFRKCGLQLRSADTKSGHWHYWYFDPKVVDFKALQRALQRRWKESAYYAEHTAELSNSRSSAPSHANKEVLAQIQQYGLSDEPKLFARQIAALRSIGVNNVPSLPKKSGVVATVATQPDPTIAALLALAAVNPNLSIGMALQSLASLNSTLAGAMNRQQPDPFLVNLQSVSTLGVPTHAGTPYGPYGMIPAEFASSGFSPALLLQLQQQQQQQQGQQLMMPQLHSAFPASVNQSRPAFADGAVNATVTGNGGLLVNGGTAFPHQQMQMGSFGGGMPYGAYASHSQAQAAFAEASANSQFLQRQLAQHQQMQQQQQQQQQQQMHMQAQPQPALAQSMSMSAASSGLPAT